MIGEIHRERKSSIGSISNVGGIGVFGGIGSSPPPDG
jgi:hypothetical protein